MLPSAPSPAPSWRNPSMSAMGQKRTFTRVLPCLLYPKKRTFVGVSAMSALCQKRTLGGLLFDHFVGGDQKRRGIMGGILLKPAPAFSDPRNFQPPSPRIFLQCSSTVTMCCSPKFARACGRVSIGRHPDKRPDSRLRLDLQPHYVIGSRRRNRRTPRSTGDAA